MSAALQGAGLGLRRELLAPLQSYTGADISFVELAPENWIDAGGRYEHDLAAVAERFPLTCHGLSLSIGSADPLDFNLLNKIKRFIRRYDVALYTEHLSWCSYNGHLYDLLPVPFNEDSVRWISQRVRQVQDILEMPIGLENASYYFTPPGSTMDEQDFVRAVVEESGCFLHLDVNNIYVNSQNFAFDPEAYLAALPLSKTGYIHVAGHYLEEDGLIIDTHGAEVIDPVWDLLALAQKLIGAQGGTVPTCLERDFNFPRFDELLQEVRAIATLQRAHSVAEQQRA